MKIRSCGSLFAHPGVRKTLTAITSTFCIVGIHSGVSTAYATEQPFPTKPLTLVVPYPAGGAADVVGRTVADGLAARYGQPVVVENRPGAGGHLGAESALRQPADGYTLVLATIAHNGVSKIYKNLRYDPQRDMQPLALIAESPNVLLVRENLPATSVPELIQLAQSKPNALNYGSAGYGSATHMAAELFKHLTKAEIVNIPFSGGAPALVALLGGQIDMTFETGSTAQQALQTGRVRALAVTSENASPIYPGVPPISDYVPGYSAAPWYTVSASSKIPDALADKLSADISAAVRSPALAERWKKLGVVPLGGTRAEARARNEAESNRWNDVITAAKLQVE